MKRICLISVVALFMAFSTAGAESKDGKPEGNRTQTGKSEKKESGIDRRLKRMSTDLELSKEQQTSIRSILEESRQKQKKMVKEYRKEMNEKRRALRDATDQRIVSVLKPAQQKKFQELKAERAKSEKMQK